MEKNNSMLKGRKFECLQEAGHSPLCKRCEGGDQRWRFPKEGKERQRPAAPSDPEGSKQQDFPFWVVK